jgi:hypothetical protein
MKKFLSKYWFVFVSSFALALSIGAAIFCFVVLGGDTAVDTTSIGYIGFGNRKDETQIKTYLSTRINQWQQDTDYSIEYQGTIYKIQFEEEVGDNIKITKLPILKFDADKSYRLAEKNKQGNLAYFNENNEAVEQMYQDMISVYGLETVNGIDKTKLMDIIMKAAQKLTRTIEIPLHECLKDEIKKNSINRFMLLNISEEDVLALIRRTTGQILCVGEINSLTMANLTMNVSKFSRQTFFTAHYVTTDDMVQDFVAAKLCVGSFSNEKLAEMDAVKALGFDITETTVTDEEGNESIEYTIDFTGKTAEEIAVIADYLKYAEYLAKWDGKLPSVMADDSTSIVVPVQPNP